MTKPRTPTISESLQAAVQEGRVRVRKPAQIDTFTTMYPYRTLDLRSNVKSTLLPRIR